MKSSLVIRNKIWNVTYYSSNVHEQSINCYLLLIDIANKLAQTLQ